LDVILNTALPALASTDLFDGVIVNEGVMSSEDFLHIVKVNRRIIANNFGS
jgi:hypothetical protein